MVSVTTNRNMCFNIFIPMSQEFKLKIIICELYYM